MSQVTRGVRGGGSRRSVNVVLLLAIVLATGLVATAFQDQRRRGEGAEALEERGDRFGRMFLLPPFALPTPAVTKALETLGQRGGLMDAGDQLAAGPLQLIVDPALNTNNPNNASHTAGTTFMGQFLDHDMTFDTTSRLGRPAIPVITPNGRHPYFDLDSVYGDGPRGSPQLYNPDDRAKFLVESGGMFEDLPRDGVDAGDHRRPAQRRNGDHRRTPGRVPAVPQQGGRSAAARGSVHRRGRRLRSGPAAHHLALPVADRPRVPAALRRPADGGQRDQPGPALLPAAA